MTLREPQIAKTAIIHPNVRLGKNVVIEDYCIIGQPAAGKNSGEIETVIGDHSVIRSFTVIYAGNVIGTHFQTGNKANIRENNQIGNHVSIGTLSVVEHHVEIADHVRIHTQAFVPEYSKLEEYAWIGPSCVLTNAPYPTSPSAKQSLKGPIIGRKARLGANSTILPGVKVGANSLIGAGSVVTRDVPDDSVFAGNPATFLKSIRDLPYE